MPCSVASYHSTWPIRPMGIQWPLSLYGLNHHRQLICLGAGLLRDEKVRSFIWLFSNFLNAMGSHKPKTIITDQLLNKQQQMFLLPRNKLAFHHKIMWCRDEISTHQFYMWHIMKSFLRKWALLAEQL